jgi:hypothetical protein
MTIATLKAALANGTQAPLLVHGRNRESLCRRLQATAAPRACTSGFSAAAAKVEFTTDDMLRPGTAFLKKVWRSEMKGVQDRPEEPDCELLLRTAKFNLREALMLLETEILCPTTKAKATGNGAGTIYTIGMDGIDRSFTYSCSVLPLTPSFSPISR